MPRFTDDETTRGGPDGQDPSAEAGILLTHSIVSADIERLRSFDTQVLGGETMREGETTIVALANGWVTINVGGGPTKDKPTVALQPPSDPDWRSALTNIRVAGAETVYGEWTERGARFLTPPIDHGSEIRCYMRDPDGHLIEVGQPSGMWALGEADA